MAKTKNLKRVVAYARVSTAEQAAKDLSIPAQLDALTAFAATRGAEVVRSFKELGASGRTGQRPVFRAMLEYVTDRSNAVDAILVYQTSRFFRDAVEARSLKVALKRQGVAVISICQETEDGPMGSFMEGMFELVDQYESDVNGMRTSAAMRKNAQLGFVNGSRPPYGYQSEHVDIGGQRKRRFTANPQEAAVVPEVFRAYVAGQGAKAVANDLNRRGYRYRGGVAWTKDHVLKAIAETAYTGTYYWGQRDNRTSKLRDRSEWIGVAVPAFVSQELFEAAQEVRGERDLSNVKGRTLSSSLLLAGVAQCELCGSTLGLETSGKVNSEGERPHRYYNCRRFLKSGKSACPGVRVPEAKLDRAVLEHLADKVFTAERCRQILKDIADERGLLREKTAAQRENLKVQLLDAQRRLAIWRDKLEERPADADVLLPRLRELQAQCAELEAALAKVVPLRAPPPQLYTDATLGRFQALLREAFLSGHNAMTRAYLRFLVERIDVRAVGVRNVELNIRGRAAAALQLLATGSDAVTESQEALDAPLVAEGSGDAAGPRSKREPQSKKPGLVPPAVAVKYPVLGCVQPWLRN